MTAHEARLVALSPELLGAAGFDGHLRFVNPAWSRLLGWSEEQLRSTPFLEFVHADDRERTRATFERLAGSREVEELTCLMLSSDGEEHPILWTMQSDEGCFHLAGRDIADRSALERELAECEDRLERINTELQEFAYIASHDLAEPLRMVTSYLDLLQRRYGEQLDETADEFIGFAVGGAVRMRTLIDDLLAYSRVGTHEMQPARLDLAECLRQVLQAFGPAVEESGARVEVAPQLASPYADPTQVSQLLHQLVSNALKFHQPGGPPAVRVTAVAEDGGVRIAVADDGIGIPPAQQERIFKMFTRLHGRDEYDGTGIGLALCRRIAERNGGRIWVESAAGADGSTFHVWLPSA